MRMVKVVPILDQEFRCARCNAAGRWIAVAKPVQRLNSSIHRLRCGQCGEQIAVKIVGRDRAQAGDCVSSRVEYETLCTLQSAFPKNGQQGTLVPLGHLSRGGYDIMITRWFDGDEVGVYARRASAAELHEIFRSAGAWLQTLHGWARSGRSSGSLEVSGKLEYLAREYARVLDRESKTRVARDLLAGTGAELDSLALPLARLHGDFKPGNMLCDGRRYVGLDIQWRAVGAVTYDLAPFLNHAWFVERGAGGARRRRRGELAREGLLAGYGDSGDPRALQWVRLYFGLCYLGSYRRRGFVAARYADWKVWPLVRELARQLDRAM